MTGAPSARGKARRNLQEFTNVDGASVDEQTREILASIDSLLAQAGSDKTKILSATIYLVDMATFPEMNKAWDGWVAQGHTPARATVEAKLAAAPYKVEIAVIAAK